MTGLTAWRVSAATGFGSAEPRSALEGLTGDERDLVAFVGHPRRLRRGMFVYRQGEVAGTTYILNEGMIRTFRVSRDGRQFTVGFWRSDDVIGGPDVFTRAPRWLSAQAITDAVLTGFSAEELDRLIAEIPRFAHNLIAILSFKSRWVMNIGDALGTGSVAQRIAHVLLLQAEVHAGPVDDRPPVITHMSHRDIATLVGASRQWVTQALADMQRQGLVELGHRRITLRHAPGLRRLADL